MCFVGSTVYWGDPGSVSKASITAALKRRLEIIEAFSCSKSPDINDVAKSSICFANRENAFKVCSSFESIGNKNSEMRKEAA